LQQLDEDQMYRKAADKVGVGAIWAAKAILTSQVKTPLTEATAERIDGLVSVPAPDEEEEALRTECALAMADAANAPAPRYRAVKQRIRNLRTHAAPGPSSWRNGLIQDVASTDAGVHALMGWATM
jgi:hypothetical protein